MTTGVLARAALIASLYNRGVHLTAGARTAIPNAALVNHVRAFRPRSRAPAHVRARAEQISTDVSRIDAAAQWFHAGWTAPVQVSICLVILCVQLGPSALAGFALFVLMLPIQERIMKGQFVTRRGSMQYTDRRAKLLMEILGARR
jgi:ATP-binding cassette subfamily C (CFTR/MRP) protein 1